MADDRFKIEIDGPDLHPNTIQTLTAVELASALFALIEKAARDVVGDKEFKFVGLNIEDKCTLISCRSSNTFSAEESARYCSDILSGATRPAYGFKDRIERVHLAVRELPQDASVKMATGRFSSEIQGSKAMEKKYVSPWSTISIRARPYLVGGKDPERPYVRFASDDEDKDFTLSVSCETAREIGSKLYHEYQILASVVRNDRRQIDDGILEEYKLVSTGDPIKTWRSWYAQNGRFWDDVENIEQELRNVRSE